MRNKFAFFLMLLALAFVLISSFAPRFAKATQVVVYNPTTIPAEQKSGYCWTSAIAVTREGAWRCMQENEIFDPCFTTQQKDIVVCNADPSKNQAGFALKLTKPLPAQEKVSVSGENAWLLQLSDGLVCSPFTGTMPIIPEKDGVKAVKYGCANPDKSKDAPSIGILDGSVKTGKKWSAQEIVYRSSPSGIKIAAIHEVAIAKVWQ